MTDDALNTAENSNKKVIGKPLAKGYDPRRWIHGRPKKPADQKKAEDIVLHVIWEELSRVITNPNTGEGEDALRLMIRSMVRNKNTQDKIIDRIAGKVRQDVDVTTGGEKVNEIKVIEVIKTYESND